MTKTAGRAGALCALLGMLAACGGSNSNDSASTTGASTSTPTSSSSSAASGSSTGSSLIALTSSNYTAAPSSTAIVTIYRSGNSTGATTVGYTTVNGTAVAGADYSTTSGTVTWSDGETAAKTVAVPVTSRAAGKDFAVALTSIQGQANFGSPTAATVAVALTPGGTSSSGSTVSASGTMIPSASQIVDSANNVWSVADGVVSENGAAAGYTANVSLLLYYGDTVYQQTTSCLWWSWSGSAWVASSNPAPSITPACSSSPASASSSSSGGGGSAGLIVGPGGKVVSTVDGSQVNLIGTAMVGMGDSQGNGSRWAGIAGLSSAQYTTALNSVYNTLSTAGKPYGKINFIRLPVSSLPWMGYHCVVPFADDASSFTSVGGGLYALGDPTTYQNDVKNAVAAIRGAGLYVVLDLHWNSSIAIQAGGNQYVCPAGQMGMPSTGDAAFWASIAATFKGDLGGDVRAV
jgi:hypothetical protein